jgi:hypothetical protein
MKKGLDHNLHKIRGIKDIISATRRSQAIKVPATNFGGPRPRSWSNARRRLGKGTSGNRAYAPHFYRGLQMSAVISVRDDNRYRSMLHATVGK